MELKRIVIAGPCAIESEEQFLSYADHLVQVFERYPALELVYKGSFDKANRSRQGSPRGVGLSKAEEIWFKLRRNHPTLRVTTDIHEAWQANLVDVDVIQIPAMLARQTDLLLAANNTGKIVNVKLPTTQSVESYLDGVGTKLSTGRNWFTYRGTATGGALAVDMNEVLTLWGNVPWPFLDVTHTNRGDMWRSVNMAKMVRSLGRIGVFAETHPRPAFAQCDADHQLSPRALDQLLEEVVGEALF